MKRLFLLLSIGCLWLTLAQAQEYPRKEIDLQSFIEELFQVQDEDLNYEDLYESLYTLYLNPLNLNTATRDELQALFILSTDQIESLLAHREKTGRLLSIYELQSVSGFDLTTIHRLLPFVTIDDTRYGDNRPLVRRILSEPNNYWIVRMERTLEEKKGFSPATLRSDSTLSTRYTGSAEKIFSRFRVSHSKDFSLGFTVEKDAGEALAWSPGNQQYGFDFNSAHFYLQNKGKFKSIALGDYQLQFGQGLVFGSGFSPGKGGETVSTTRRSTLGVRPFTSVLESTFLRGGAATYQVGAFDITAFYSHQRQDANLQTDTLENNDFFAGVQVTGFHRTPSELANKNAIGEQVAGGNVMYRSTNGRWQVGANYLYTAYDATIRRNPRKYNQFDFSGASNYVGGLYFAYIWQNLNFFGEYAQSASGGQGMVGGLVGSLGSKIDFSMVARNYERNFHSFYGAAFGEQTVNNNERGIYWGIKVSPISRFWITAYYDKFAFPWLTYRTDAPSEGAEHLLRFNYQPARRILLYAQFRQETKDRNTSRIDLPIKYVVEGRKRNAILNLDYAVNAFISLKSRMQVSDYLFEGNRTTGYTLMQDISFEKGPIRIATRYAMFDTEDYENRQYVYERDVLYGFSIPAYSGLGTRSYLVLQYNASRKLSFWARISRFNYLDRETVGSGLEETQGRFRTDIKLQVRYKF
ncbi:helix-hairpin-helix domain-containing protein [Cytophagales bacterium LB-30]|uniref:Helix-hairpin-helix domain-containing protein n=1 Tax=Shiella aurantiaca TaxID=3058365 RepID=A0ABT8F356_9BACT|nr:helix-hairpin-helix domain-containing protein [Shiella aurantiaca]MDN4164892.1 helix-hairpin-helix domain-containing protein [Shiella aurantiaca]